MIMEDSATGAVYYCDDDVADHHHINVSEYIQNALRFAENYLDKADKSDPSEAEVLLSILVSEINLERSRSDGCAKARARKELKEWGLRDNMAVLGAKE